MSSLHNAAKIGLVSLENSNITCIIRTFLKVDNCIDSCSVSNLLSSIFSGLLCKFHGFSINIAAAVLLIIIFLTFHCTTTIPSRFHVKVLKAAGLNNGLIPPFLATFGNTAKQWLRNIIVVVVVVVTCHSK